MLVTASMCGCCLLGIGLRVLHGMHAAVVGVGHLLGKLAGA